MNLLIASTGEKWYRYVDVAMRHLNATEKGGLALAGLLAISGGIIAIHPVALSYTPTSYKGPRVSEPIHISREAARIYGIMGTLMGIGLGCLVFYRKRN